MHAHIQKLLIFGLVVFFLISWSTFFLPLPISSPVQQETSEATKEGPIYNNTLGYQRVFALALPDRADRTIPLLDAANATNITVTVLDAVRDAEIDKDAWPKGWAEDRVPAVGELGCLVSHVRTWKKMIAERIATALILESDADWDMRVKDIMTGVAEGVHAVADWPFTPVNDTKRFGPPMDLSPYGPNWDIVWMGHCGSSWHGNGRIYSVNDTSVPPEDREYTFASGPQDEQHRPGTRTVFQMSGTVCSTGYAISYAGAVKLAEYFKEGQDNLDLKLAQLCRDKMDLACFGVWPQVMTAASSHSNIEHEVGAIAPTGYNPAEVHPGPAIQYSARMNAAIIQQGLGKESWQAEWHSTWAMVNDEWTEVSLEEAKVLEESTRWANATGGSNSTTIGTRSW